MANYIFRFSKQGLIRFTSHLDMVRLFKRSFKKIGVQLQYSQGFNPHPKMVFAQPLSLGYTSECEVLEIETKEDYVPSDIMNNLNKILPTGLEILSSDYGQGGKKAFAKNISSAKYLICFDNTMDITKEHIDKFVDQDEIIVLKRKKKSRDYRELNIKPMIRKVEAAMVDDKIFLSIDVDAGSVSNLSPDIFLTAFCKEFDIDKGEQTFEIQRIELK